MARKALPPTTPLGKALRALRSDANVSSTEAAREAGISQPALSRYETGARVPDPASVKALCRVCRVSDETRRELVALADATHGGNVAADVVTRRGGWQMQERVTKVEQSAELIRAWNPSYVEGDCQTRAYARACFAMALCRRRISSARSMPGWIGRNSWTLVGGFASCTPRRVSDRRAAVARQHIGAGPCLAARRLGAESVGLVFAARVLSDDLVGLPEVVVGTSGGRCTGTCWTLCCPTHRRPGPRRDHLGVPGQPAGFVGTATGVDPAELAGGFGLPSAVPLARSIEEIIRRRIEALSDQARRLVLLAASDPAADPAVVWQGNRPARDRRRCRSARGRRRTRRVRHPAVVPATGPIGGLPVGGGARRGGRRTAPLPG